ncbi:MAG: metallophosphatase domain-containing protein [Bacteroidota bacterium]
MKMLVISDTHGQHGSLRLPKGELLLHCGDVCKRGSRAEVEDFLSWFAKQDFEHKVFIAGNHDFFFETADEQEIKDMIPEGVTYLNDSGVTINGLRIWGSPVQPWFLDWAFNRQRGEEIDRHWQLIPEQTDILLVHGPPYGILDKTIRGEQVGCRRLLARIEEIRPRYCFFGHIHEAYGRLERAGTTFVNASVLDVQYCLNQLPVQFS